MAEPLSTEAGEWTRRAVDVMTAWASQASGEGFAASRVAEYVKDGPEAAMKLTVGFVNLTAILLLRLEETSGQDVYGLLRDASRVTL